MRIIVNMNVWGEDIMMINKRLINLCSQSKKYIVLTILVNWIAIMCNIITIILIGQFINKVYIGGVSSITMESILKPGIIILILFVHIAYMIIYVKITILMLLFLAYLIVLQYLCI